MTFQNSNINFEKLFNPRSLAFVGATPVPGKWGFIIMANILRGNFQGKIFPVNPNYTSLYGMPCYPSVSAIQDEIDLAVIIVSANRVSAVIDECISKGVPNAVVITSDFSETGEEGALLEREITAKARAGGMRLVGPNTMGIFNAYSKLNVLMSPIKAETGYVSIISQSGNVGIQILNGCIKQGIGVSKLVSSGNEADIKCEDYLSYFVKDEKTKVIVLYIESFKSGQEFIKVCKEIKAAKPIIIYKAGKTKGGMSAAASHTGAMAGSIEVYRSVFKQYGVIEAESEEEIIDLAGGFISYPLPKGNRVGIITIGGGWGVITADECEARGLVLPQLSSEVYDKLNKLLPKYWSKKNPVDMAAVLSLDAHIKSLEVMVSWDDVDAVISLGLNAVEKYLSYYQYDDISKLLGFKKEQVDVFFDKIYKQLMKNKKIMMEFIKKYNKPVIQVEIKEEHTVFNNNSNSHDYAKFKSPEGAVKVLKKMYDFYQMQKRMNE